MLGVLCSCFSQQPKVDPCTDSYLIQEALIEKVNGIYYRQRNRMDGVPFYRNEVGVVLFRYQMASGSAFWYLSSQSDDFYRSEGDYYRVKSESVPSHLADWSCSHSPDGRGPAPVISLIGTDPGPDPCSKSSLSADMLPLTGGDEIAIDISVSLLSGSPLGTVPVYPSSTGLQVKFVLRPFLQERRYVTKLIYGEQVFDDLQTVKGLQLEPDASLQAIVQEADCIVRDAGAPEVNGSYIRQDELMVGAPCYVNEHGTLLFRYCFTRSHSHYWYFSKASGELQKSENDYFRVKTEELKPPATGWVSASCLAGRDPSPTVMCF
ncbi:unnamed protein product [Polarella glacialis]|uniref:Uncharacterized protein n=1 Tax=Polarella glacialis TaxID=89957 RepID=A0A813LAN6_POLGL|nr:unnamed protein product [Polarella glacialis]